MIEAVFLGILQGLTEFLPISSSAHIRIAGLFSSAAADPGATFTAIIQIGTELAVLTYFRKDIVRIIKAWFASLISSRRNLLSPDQTSDARLGWLVIAATFPILLLGYLFQDAIRTNLRSLWIVATVILVFGLVLGLADKFGRSEKSLTQMTIRNGVLCGLAQCLALIPGVSRSGATIAMARSLGYTREAALRFSFLLALPAVFASGLYELLNSLSDKTLSPFSTTETAVATLTSFVVGYVVIAWFLKFVTTRSFMPFVFYRVILSLALFGLLGFGVVAA